MEAPKKSNTKLNTFLTIESDVQAKWEKEKTFEENAPENKRFTILNSLFLNNLISFFN